MTHPANVAPIDWLTSGLLATGCVTTIAGTRIWPSPIHGRGPFATRTWPAGAELVQLDGQVVDVRIHPEVIDTLEWNALDPDRLLVRGLRTSYGMMNHNPNPTVAIDKGGRIMRASCPIAAGDELTIDYLAQPVPPAYLDSPEAIHLAQR